MLLWGTINPAGEQNDYKGFYYTKDDIRRCVDSAEMVGKPVRIEHVGSDVGRVVSAWQNNKGQMDCVLEIDQKCLEGAVVSKFVGQGVCKELSLGYVVDVQNSDGCISATNKHVVEVSIVRKGARQDCYIHGYSGVKK